MRLLVTELYELERDALSRGMQACCRLNGTSDICWERDHEWLLRMFPGIEFVDYTKIPQRAIAYAKGKFRDGTPFLPNYTLCFSLHERNSHHVRKVLDAGANVAVVFHPKIPSRFLGYPTIDGTKHDARFLDPKPGSGGPVIVGLKSLGWIEERDRYGFVVRTDQKRPSIPRRRITNGFAA